MKYVFFGTPEFAAIVLEKLVAAGFVPVAVVCNPDRPVGRKKVVTAPAIKERIMNYESRIKDKIAILQPEKLDTALRNSLFAIRDSFDFFIVAAYTNLIPKSILDIPKLGTIGVHPSLLPKYRGPSPIQTALLDGETETGVTLYLVDEEVDHGPILATSHWPLVTRDNYETLLEKLAVLGGELLIRTLPKFLEGQVPVKEQNHKEATLTKKFKTENGFVPLMSLKRALENKDTAEQIFRKILALNPEPGVYTIDKNGKRVKLLKARVKEGALELLEIQKEGERSKPSPFSFEF